MSAVEKAEVLTRVASSPVPKRKVLMELAFPKAPTTGGSDARTIKDLRAYEEAVRRHGTVLLFRKNASFCDQPGRCRS